MKKYIVNLSEEPLRLSRNVTNFKKIIVLPDYSPGRYLPTGITIAFDASRHKFNKHFLGSDIGCGMLIAKFRNPIDYKEIKTGIDKQNIILKYFLSSSDLITKQSINKKYNNPKTAKGIVNNVE